jgi:hypothetical protein
MVLCFSLAPPTQQINTRAEIRITHAQLVASVKVILAQKARGYQFIELKIRKRLEKNTATMNDFQTTKSHIPLKRI